MFSTRFSERRWSRKTRSLWRFVLSAWLALLVTLPTFGLNAEAAPLGQLSGRRVVLDPGHGWRNDTGATGNGMREADITLDVANRAKAILERHGAAVGLTRTGYEPGYGLEQADDRANAFNPDVVVSIHVNAGGGTGTESCYTVDKSNSPESQRLAGLLTTKVSQRLGLRIRGNFPENRPGRRCGDNHYLYIHWMNAPAAIIEMAFIDGPLDNDVAKLRDRRQDFAQAIVDAVVEYLGENNEGSGAVYNTAFLTDAQLEDYNSMNAEQIRAFLASQGSYFSQPVQDVDGQTFDPPVTIAQAARQYRINPKVILATMQKESSSVTNPGPPANMAFLMGCISPNTARQQIACAAERFRTYHDQLTQNGSTVSGWRVGVPKTTQDGVTVTPATKAVAGQFTYTPYAGERWGGNRPGVGGVYLFYTIWQRFGFDDSGNTPNCSADQYRAEYFENISLTGNPRFVRCENWPINHEWGSGGPGNGVGNDNFSVRWTGSAHFDGGNYTFIARADDGIRVWLDDTLVIDAWRDQPPTVYRQTRSVSSGTHRIRVEFYEHGGGATAQFHWERSDSGGGGGGSQGDRYEPDNSPAQAKNIGTDGSAQTHDFHVAGDFDWLKFNATQGHRYTIETLNLGPNSDTYLYLYDTNGSSLLVEDDDGGSSYASRIVWTAPRNGAYFVKVRHYNRSASGPDTRYDIRIQDNGTGGGGSSNLVLGRSAYATSHESASRAPSKGNDGRRDTRWSSRISSSLEPQLWWVDLGSPQTFDRVVIRWEAAYAGQYFVGTSNDGQHFYGHWYTTNAPGSYRYDLGTRTARYIGVYMTERAPRMNNYSFWELEAYNTARRSSNQPQGMDAIEAISIEDSAAGIPAPAQLLQITTLAEQGKFKGTLKITKIELLPESGQPYLVLSLQGSGFTDMTKVAIWNEEGELSIDDVTRISNEELHVTLPPETKSGTYKVRVINSNGDMAAGTVTIPGPTDSHRIFLPMVVR